MNAEFKFLKAARRDVKRQASAIILYWSENSLLPFDSDCT
jgi:hypothetical protein